jgi:hypothetical protein
MTVPLHVAVVTETWAPQSMAALDWERIHDRLVDALREAIAPPAIQMAHESIYRFLPD